MITVHPRLRDGIVCIFITLAISLPVIYLTSCTISHSHRRCDWKDGRWKDNGVDYKCLDDRALVSFSCRSSTNSNVMGTAKDSGQITTCGQKTRNGNVVTCQNPKVQWGSQKHIGYPHKHSNNNYNTYCKSLGYTGFVTGSDKYGTVKCSKGALFWCKGYDFNGGYHW